MVSLTNLRNFFSRVFKKAPLREVIATGSEVVIVALALFVFSQPVSSFSLSPPPSPEEIKTSTEFQNFGLVISKIDLLVPVVENVDGSKKTVYNQALEKGVAHYQGTSLPGGSSNVFIFGHSSTKLNQGPYATIFARLDELQNDDSIIVTYHSQPYKYTVFAKEVVEKTNLAVLEPTEEEQLTLMTCWPLGTKDKRLIIKAKRAP